VPGSLRGASAAAGAAAAAVGVEDDDAGGVTAGVDGVDVAAGALAGGAVGAADDVAAVDEATVVVSPCPGPYFMKIHSPAATATNATPSTTAIAAVCDFAAGGALDAP